MEIANAYGPSDKFQLLTNDFEGRHQRLLSKEDFIEQLNDVKISPAAQLLSNVLIRQNELLAQNKGAVKFSYLLSDFQKNSVDLEPKGLDTSVHVTLIPIRSSERNNVYIDSCWFETPVQQYGMPQKLHVSIVNHSDRVIENGALKLYINNEQINPGFLQCEARKQNGDHSPLYN